MRIHSDILNASHFFSAVVGLDGVWVDECNPRGSRSRKCAYEVRLAASQKPGRNRRRNSGQYGADSLFAATYDEHGHWMAKLFNVDPNAIIGPYDGEINFHRMTDGNYGSA